MNIYTTKTRTSRHPRPRGPESFQSGRLHPALHRPRRRGPKATAAAAVLTAGALLIGFAGCNLVAALASFENSLTVTRGDYTDSIELNWSSNHDIDGDDSVDPTYEIYRERQSTQPADNVWGTNIKDTRETDYTDSSVALNGTLYWYRIKAVDLSGYPDEQTDWEYGYRLDSSVLKLRSQGSAETYSVTVADTRDDSQWFHFQAQEGWTYIFETSGNTKAGVILYYEEILDSDEIWSFAGSVTKEWTCSESGDYYLRAYNSTDTASISFNITAYHQ